MFAKTGPRTKRKLRLPVAVSSSRISVPVMSLRGRREPDPPEVRSNASATADHERLRQAGHANQQGVTAGEHRDQNLVERATLTHDSPAHLGAQPDRGRDQ
jgi:hypothetical protein